MTKQATILVTGGASGIGLAIVKELVHHGWKVVAADIEQKTLDAAQEALAHETHRARFMRMDVTKEDEVKQSVALIEEEFGPLKGLVNSAGIARDVPFLQTTPELFRRILDVNLIGSFIVAREVALRLQHNGGGSIVNIASVSGMRGNLGRTAYGASKGAVITMTQVMAVELAPLNIRVNAIAPGPVDTPLVKTVHTSAVREDWLATVPQHRYAEPREIAGAARFLIDDTMSSFVTGQIIAVDGGFTAGGLI